MSSHKCCHHESSVSSVYQTLEELDFERGIWSFAMYGDLEKLRGMLDKGTDPSICDSSGYTALHYAARNGKETACALLLQRGASVNAQTHGGATPLHRAAAVGHINIVKLLLKFNGDPSVCDSDGKTALHKAAEGQHLDVSKIFVELKPELKTMKDNRGHTPVFYVKTEKAELLNILSN